MDEPNSARRNDWAAQGHIFWFGRCRWERISQLGRVSSRKITRVLIGHRRHSRRYSGCTGSRPRPCASGTAIRQGRGAVSVEKSDVAGGASRHSVPTRDEGQGRHAPRC